MTQIKKQELTLKNFTLTDKTAIDFVRNFLVDYNNKHETLLDGRFYCQTFRRRSVEDIYNLTRNYFPEITQNDVIEILIDLLFENKEDKNYLINGIYCSGIKRTVFKCWPANKDAYYSYKVAGSSYVQFFDFRYDSEKGFNPIFIERIRARLENLK